MSRYFGHTGHVMLTISASSPELATVQILSIQWVWRAISLWFLICIHIRIRGIVLTLCVYCLLYLLWRTFRLNILFQFNCIIFFIPRLCKILYTTFALESSRSFLPCFPLSFPLKKTTIINGNGFLWLTCLLSKPLILVSFFLKLCNPKLRLLYAYGFILEFSMLYLLFRMTIHLE